MYLLYFFYPIPYHGYIFLLARAPTCVTRSTALEVEACDELRGKDLVTHRQSAGTRRGREGREKGTGTAERSAKKRKEELENEQNRTQMRPPEGPEPPTTSPQRDTFLNFPIPQHPSRSASSNREHTLKLQTHSPRTIKRPSPRTFIITNHIPTYPRLHTSTAPPDPVPQ